MARKLKISAGKLNIRLHPHSRERYSAFLRKIYDLRAIGHVHGDRYGMISQLDSRQEQQGFISGIITTFLKIDTEGTWFNTSEMKEATDDQVSKISIPANLNPNAATFYFEFDLAKHQLAFQDYSNGKWLTPGSALKFFSSLSRDMAVMASFGEAKISIVQHAEGLERLFSLKKISEIKITLLKPNPDIFSDDFDEQIEAHLEVTHSRSITLTYEADIGSSIQPTPEIRQVSAVALENGKVEVKGRDDTGAVRKSTEDFPDIVQARYDPEVTSERSAFFALLRGIIPNG
ncbi:MULTISPECIES: DUF4747 family protein [unclassified Mesorhizobium]|uniref:DUF4747 family protein n=1 Tax=unclassified Mesorhizobium TaxID=325217 RepID=UPI0030146935